MRGAHACSLTILKTMRPRYRRKPEDGQSLLIRAALLKNKRQARPDSNRFSRAAFSPAMRMLGNCGPFHAGSGISLQDIKR